MVSEQQATEESGSQPEINAPSPGKMLREKREALGHTQQQVAEKLFLKSRQINELENDELDSNASITFTKGYVRNYAKYLGLDANEVVATFEQFHKSVESPAQLQSFSRRVAKQTHDDRWMLVTYIILLLIAGGIVVWWLQQPSDESIVETSLIDTIKEEAGNTSITNTNVAGEQPLAPNTASETGESVDMDGAATELGSAAAEIGSAATDLESDIDEGSATVSSADQTGEPSITVDETNNLTALASRLNNDAEPELSLNTNSTTTNATSTSPVSSDTPPIMMTFTFSEDCWVNIQDATGEAIAYGVKKSGRVMEIQGIPPVEVTLGAADNVRIHVDGEPIDLSAYDNSRTARFTLPM